MVQTHGEHQPNAEPEAADPESVVRLIGIRKSFGHQRVLREVDLAFRSSQTTVVLGPSGCGKSVMLKHIVGLMRPDEGQVWYGDTRVDVLSERKLVPIRQQFGFLFQQGALFDSMSVRQNVAFPLVEHTSLREAERNERIERMLALVGLSDTLDKMPADLSGGQRKRVALARAIVLEPRVILYDEPTTGLDPVRADVINELILKLGRELDVTNIVVTHDLASAFKIADSLVMLYDGRVVMEGTPSEFRQADEPVVQRFLQGEATAEELEGIHRAPINSGVRG